MTRLKPSTKWRRTNSGVELSCIVNPKMASTHITSKQLAIVEDEEKEFTIEDASD